MTELTFIGAPQEVTVNGKVRFNVRDKSGCGEIQLTDTDELMLTRTGRYLIMASANVALPEDGTANTPVSFGIFKDGEVVNETIATVTPTAVSRYFNISKATIINVRKCCGATISWRNVGTTDAVITNQDLIAIKLEGGV